ncbi:MAG: winged helix-turn-helix domain-containing protein [Candidatus Altiarchaeota archaeon]
MDLWGEIGTTAGEIYTKFAGKKATDIASIKKKIKSKVGVEIAIGWLAREGKARLQKKGAKLSVEILP